MARNGSKMDRGGNSSRTMLQSRCSSRRLFFNVVLVSALLGERYVTPADAFCATTSSHAIASRSSGASERSSARRSYSQLFGIKRKVEVDLQENFSGKVVDSAGPMSGALGGNANALFEVIERNKERAVEAAAVAEAARRGKEKDAGDKDVELEDADGGDGEAEGR